MKKYELTPEHREQLKPLADKWIANAMSTKAMDDEERAICRKSVKEMYRAANLVPPPDERIVFVPSPFVMRFAGGFSAAVWFLRKHGTLPKGMDATRAATEDATRAATEDATDAATWAATDAATRAATDAATWDATDAATWAATVDATSAATRAATDAATRDATDAATRAATWAATDAATRDATRDATWAATWAATVDATSAATDAATWAATDAATRAATDAAKSDMSQWFRFPVAAMKKLSDALGLAELGLQCANSAYNMWNGGNQWSGYVSFLCFFRHVAKLELDYSKYDSYEQLAIHSGPRIMHEKFCMISDRPSKLVVDERNRPHCDTGPFCEWRDGSALYSLHGIRVPAWMVETPVSEITKEHITKEKNADVRRELIRRIGMKRVAEILDYKVIDKMDEYELITFDIGDGRVRPYLMMKCPTTDSLHIEGVRSEITTVKAALAYRFGQFEWKRPHKEA